VESAGAKGKGAGGAAEAEKKGVEEKGAGERGEAGVEEGLLRGWGFERPAMSERERILRRNGKEAAEAYDRLMRMHEAHRQGQEAGKGAESSEGDGSAPSDRSAESQAGEEREEAAQTPPVLAESGENNRLPASIPPPDPASANGGEFKTMGELGS
jgi:hypothetical protein